MTSINIVFQSDPVTQVEKSTVRHAVHVSTNPINTYSLHLADIQHNTTVPLLSLPVGTVEFCRHWMEHCDVYEPIPVDFPKSLTPWFGRIIQMYPTYDEAPNFTWVKPYATKDWDAHLKTSFTTPQDGWVWSSEPLNLQAEWRVYVINGKIVGVGRYDDNEGEIDESIIMSDVQEMVRVYTSSGQAPSAYALDVALTNYGQVVLVEVTDAWAIGYYKGTCSAPDYLRLLDTRWQEIIKVNNHFQK